MCLHHVWFPPTSAHTFSTIPNRLTSSASSTGWHSHLPYIPSVLGYEITSLAGCNSGMWHNAHGNFGLKGLMFLIYVLGSQGWLMGLVEIRINFCTYGYQPFSSRMNQAWAGGPVSPHHTVCRPKTNAKYRILLMEILPLKQFHSSGFHSIWLSSTMHLKDTWPNIQVWIQPRAVWSSQVQPPKK